MYKNIFSKYSGGWAGILRVCFWCILFIYAFGFLVPPQSEKLPLQSATAGTKLTPMVTIPEDPRSIRSDVTVHPDKLNIAWLMDSTGVVLPKGKNFVTATEIETRLLPDFVMKQLAAYHDLSKIDVQLYGRLGFRPIDLMAFTFSALQKKPDFVVVPVNYAWSFSHYQIANRKLALNLAPKAWSQEPKYWWMIPTFSSPSEILWVMTSPFLPLMADVTKDKGYFESLIRIYLPEHKDNVAIADTSLRQPKTQVAFWLVNSMMDGNQRTEEDPALSTERRYVEMIRHNQPGDPTSFTTLALEGMLESARKRDIPVLFYMSPVSDDYYADPEVKQHLAQTEAYMGDLARRYAGTNVHIIAAIPENIRKSITFQAGDGFHQNNVGQLDAYLASEIWKIIGRNPKLEAGTK